MDFVTAEERCPVESRTLWADAAATTAVTNGLLPYIDHKQTNVQTQTIYMVMTELPLKFMKGMYYFYVKMDARGGATLTTPLMSLEVFCGVGSTIITESTTHPDIQYQDVGSNHGWYFTNYTSQTDCPVFTY